MVRISVTVYEFGVTNWHLRSDCTFETHHFLYLQQGNKYTNKIKQHGTASSWIKKIYWENYEIQKDQYKIDKNEDSIIFIRMIENQDGAYMLLITFI